MNSIIKKNKICKYSENFLFLIIIMILFYTFPARSDQKKFDNNVQECYGIKLGTKKSEIEKRLGRPPEVASGDTIAAGELTQGSGFRKFETWLYRNKGIIIHFDKHTNRIDSLKCSNKNQ